jgi:hypothetical protein
MQAHLTARVLKVTVVLDPAEVAKLTVPDQPRMTLSIQGGGEIRVGGERVVTADLASKSVRKAQAAIREHGAEAMVVVLQGKLIAGDQLTEAGLVAHVKATKPVEAAA